MKAHCIHTPEKEKQDQRHVMKGQVYCYNKIFSCYYSLQTSVIAT